MKYLTLIRHAKSSWDDDQLDDRDRPLGRRGRKQVGFMAPVMHASGAFDSELHASPARRTADTVRFLLDHADLADRTHTVQYDDDLYTFDADDLWHWLAEDRTVEEITLVGHNPALLDLANRLANEPLPALPTCALVRLRLRIDRWAELAPCCASITHQLIPAWVDYKTFKKRRPLKPKGVHAHKLLKRTRALLRYQSDMIGALEPGVRVGADPEFMHQYRTHLRRSRSVGQALLRLQRNKPLKRQLKALKNEAQATSELRDLDVLLMRLRDWEKETVYRKALIELKLFDAFTLKRNDQHQALLERLNSQQHRERMDSWRAFLDSADFEKAAKAVTLKSVQDAVDELVAEHDRRLESLTEASPDGDFHELRKLLKKLRYLLELVVDPKGRRMKALKQRQKRFGQLQDLTVQLQYLQSFQEQTKAAKPGLRKLLKDLSTAKTRERQAILAMDPFGDFVIDPGR
ncbi:CHAD domain-containing protein [Saccharospirillum salsuginis]|uniref:CHAD domain-containing protein n=1 Tax=Saccharospirillum salsuginis TaxID=418750 RepID=UPI001675F63F|nr:CHAD domain-containing protein [Saccharospirillum salsuginis]